MQISIETLRKHLNEDLPKVEIELNKRIKVTDFSLLEERSKSIRELVKATIEKPHPFLLTMPNVSITLSQEFKEAKTEKLVTVNCTDATTMPKWTLGVGGVIDMAGGFEALLETLGGFEALLKTLGGFEALCKGAGGFQKLCKVGGGFKALVDGVGYENWLRLAVQPSQIFRNGERYPMDVTGNGKVVTSSGRAHAFVSGADNDHCIVKVVQQGHCPYSGIALLNSSKKYSGGSNDLMCPFQDGDMRNAFGEKRETPSFSNEAVVIFAREEQHVTWCVNGKHERFARPSIETNLVVVSNGGRAKYKIM